MFSKVESGPMTKLKGEQLRIHYIKTLLVLQLEFQSGLDGSNLQAALRMARDLIYGGPMNRADHHDLIVLFTDGGSVDYTETLDLAIDLRIRGIEIFVVSLGKWIRIMELYQIASEPSDVNLLKADSVESFSRLTTTIKNAICDCK